MTRFLDILFSLMGIILFFPLFIFVSVMLKFTGEGKIFFLQERIGLNNKKFKIIKFVTMLKNSPNMGSKTITVKNDPRILPFGRFLRKSKINELPQLFNIFFGEMSIIGPRPLTHQAFDNYSSKIKEIIVKAKPGLSGVGSIIFRNEEDIIKGDPNSLETYKNIILPYKGLLEEWFFFNKSIYVYFCLILITIWILFFPKSKIIWRIFKDLPKPPKELIN